VLGVPASGPPPGSNRYLIIAGSEQLYAPSLEELAELA
jgi:hypothetical protein